MIAPNTGLGGPQVKQVESELVKVKVFGARRAVEGSHTMGDETERTRSERQLEGHRLGMSGYDRISPNVRGRLDPFPDSHEKWRLRQMSHVL